ncbi:hypothetical protein DL769_002457 [Monosporascus sp. CRB-8-3]|nr:hypothetical protein DL769_002457 [Monosporascus sp. CRB-8-3]
MYRDTIVLVLLLCLAILPSFMGRKLSNGDPFEVLAPDSRFVFVSDAKHIKELDTAPDAVLSLNAASKHMLQPVYTMNGFNWFDKRGTEGVGFVRTLRTLLTNNLPNILPERRVLNHIRFEQLRQKHEIVNEADCIQWIMETAPKRNPWSAERIIYELMAIWFGSVHILSTPLRAELEAQYENFERTGQGLPLLDSFIEESARLTPVESMSTRRCALQPFTLSDGTKLAVGDWACTPSGAIMRSEEHYPAPSKFNGFRFVDSAILAQLRDPSSFSSLQSKPSKLTDVDNAFLMWGTGRMACCTGCPKMAYVAFSHDA